MSKLETVRAKWGLDRISYTKTTVKASVFVLEAIEKTSIITALIQQLLSYGKFRDWIEARAQDLVDGRRKLKELQQWNVQQKREATEARQAKEAERKAEAEESEEKKPAITKPKKTSKELQSLRTYLRAVNSGLRVHNTAEIRRMAYESFPYSEMELEEIEEFRQIQRLFHVERIEKVVAEVFDQQCKGLATYTYICILHHTQSSARLGMCLLGRDRAYRSYTYLDFDADKKLILLIESPKPDEIPPCLEPTPMEQQEKDSSGDEKADEEQQLKEESTTEGHVPEEREKSREESVGGDELDTAKRLTVCTGKASTCPVHCDRPSTSFSYYAEENGIQKVCSYT